MREDPKGLEPGGEEMPTCEHCLGDTWGQKEMESREDERRMKTSTYLLAWDLGEWRRGLLEPKETGKTG